MLTTAEPAARAWRPASPPACSRACRGGCSLADQRGAVAAKDSYLARHLRLRVAWMMGNGLLGLGLDVFVSLTEGLRHP